MNNPVVDEIMAVLDNYGAISTEDMGLMRDKIATILDPVTARVKELEEFRAWVAGFTRTLDTTADEDQIRLEAVVCKARELEEKEPCEGCGEPVVTRSADDYPLCAKCHKAALSRKYTRVIREKI